MERHASDGVLLALYDHQRDADLDSPRRHVERCAECQARLETIAARATNVRVALAAIPTPSVAKDDFRRRVAEARQQRNRRDWRRPVWLAAAAVVVLVGAAAALPIREWVRRRLVESRTEHAPPQPVAPPSTQPPNRSGATVSFTASGPDFTVRFDSLPAVGNLIAGRTTTDQISARVASGAGTGGDAMVVLPGELLVRNTSAARASYDLLLPDAVTRLRIIVAGRVVFDGAPPTTIPLNRSK
jgi:hypothetical protein